MAHYNFVTDNGLPIMIEDGQQLCTVDGQRYLVFQNVNNGVNNGNQNNVVTYSTFNESEPTVYSHQALIGTQSSAALDNGQNVYILETGEIAVQPSTFKTEPTPTLISVGDNIPKIVKGTPKVSVNNPNEKKNNQWIVTSNCSKTPSLTMNNQTQKNAAALAHLEQGRMPKPRSRFPSPAASISGSDTVNISQNILASSTPRHPSTQTLRLTNIAPNAVVGPPKPTARPPIRGDNMVPRRGGLPRAGTPRHSTPVRQYMDCLSERIKSARIPRMPQPHPHQQQQQQQQQLRQLQQKQQQQQQQQHQQQPQQHPTISPQQFMTINNSIKRPVMTQTRPRVPMTPTKQVTQHQRPLPPCPSTPDSSPEKMEQSCPSTPERSGDSFTEQISPADNDTGSESFVYLQRTIKDPATAIVQQQVTGSTVKMLVVLASGEQRLITFDIPAEECTVQDLLEQINIPFNGQTIVSLVTDAALNINYIVESEAGVIHTMHDTSDPSESQSENLQSNIQVSDDNSNSNQQEEPKYIEGKSTLCPYCGTYSFDFNRCYKCKKSLPSDSRPIAMAQAPSQRKKEMVAVENFYKKRNEINKFDRGDLVPRKRGRPPRGPTIPTGTIINKIKQIKEPECLTLSSDDDDDDEDGNSSRKKTTAQHSKSSVANSNTSNSSTTNDEIDLISEKEPVITNNQIQVQFQIPLQDQDQDQQLLQNNSEFSLRDDKNNGESLMDEDNNLQNKIETSFVCRTVRIGSYKYVPREKIILNKHGLKLVVPLLEDQNQCVTINVKINEIVKVLIHFGKAMPVLFFYTSPNCGANIRELLGMQDSKGPYYDPAGKDQTHKRITLLPEKISEEAKNICKFIFPLGSKMEDLNGKEANDILVRASPKDNSQMQLMIKKQTVAGLSSSSSSSTAINNSNIVNGRPNDRVVQKLTVYPPPPAKSGIAINTEDYSCLGEDQFLNDVIIDFYLKYLTLEVLSEEDQNRTHVFSSYFYKRLTSRHAQSADTTNSVSPAAKRHARVQKWTKNVNIFEKDFVIIPINEHAHWFLAIICYPGLVGTILPSHVITKEPDTKKLKKNKELKVQTLTIGSTTITPVATTTTITIDQADEDSERDEAEGDEDELDMDSEDDEESSDAAEGDSATSVSITPVEKPSSPVVSSEPDEEPFRSPCILIFDSLKGASRSRVVATLRDYLSCEYQAKLGKEKVFSKDTIKGACPKVPQQSNFTDCGLYLLQYVESFFKDPIKNYTIPIKTLKNWFEEIVVTRKREELSNLLIKLMNDTKGDKNIILPSVQFPTQDGKLKPKSENSEKSDLKTPKTESEAKRNKVEDEQSSNNINNNNQQQQQQQHQQSQNDSQELTPRKTLFTLVPYSSASSTSSGELNSVEMLLDIKSKPTPNTNTAILRSKRIPRLMQKEPDTQDTAAITPPIPVKKHKGDSLDSCK
ncbi:uncharacterized protein LOC130665499 [Microplitis mediator]|uniref:uncharacterized protein LOC130665499 n=1 Tax=Microplitis mediator TaxID=375433 RepID=UPI0025565DEB|nr:uncharacterized protein LOC130665499 [Microplitis mediator]XP_057321905.1 uncharacterized protein LOC130665499 [Microplitis mediator]XP_057321906.1 uncharacterized protein LOC130665499 [Microplitis mediator]